MPGDAPYSRNCVASAMWRQLDSTVALGGDKRLFHFGFSVSLDSKRAQAARLGLWL